MKRLLLAASESAASSLRRSQPASIPSAPRLLAARYFSDSAADDNVDDEEVKVGTVKFYHRTKHFGFIIPDGVSRPNHVKEEFMVHGTGIRTADGKRFNSHVDYRLAKGERIQFKTIPPEQEGRAGKAYDLTLEGGGLAYEPKHLRNNKYYIWLGREVMEIIDRSNTAQELETRLVAAYETTKARIERDEAKIWIKEPSDGNRNEEEAEHDKERSESRRSEGGRKKEAENIAENEEGENEGERQ